MATTIKGGRAKTTVTAKARSKTAIKSRGKSQTKIGKSARKPRNKKLKALAGADASKLKGGAGIAPSLAPSVASSGGGLEFWAPTIDSAVATRDRTITLSLHYNEAGWDSFVFKRTNLNYQTTTEFIIDVPLNSTDDVYYTVDDIGATGTRSPRTDRAGPGNEL